MPAYTAILALTFDDRTTLTYLSSGANPVFTPIFQDAAVFTNPHDARKYLSKHGFPPSGHGHRGLHPRPGFIKGSTVQYRALAVPSHWVQWPAHLEDEEPSAHNLRRASTPGIHRVASMRLFHQHRKDAIERRKASQQAPGG